MKPIEFAYWLQGFLEMSDAKTLNEKQVAALRAHLALVFEHVIDPSYVAHLPPAERAAQMDRLQSIHDGNNVLDYEEDEDGSLDAEVDEIVRDVEAVQKPPPKVRRLIEGLEVRPRPRFDPHRVYKC